MGYIVTLLILFFSGLFLWDTIDTTWEIQRWFLFWHAPISIIFILFYLAPYMLAHLKYHLPKLKDNPTHKQYTGIVFGVTLFISVASGGWLMFVGQRGEMLGKIAQFAHLWSSFGIVVFALVHSTIKLTRLKVSYIAGLVLVTLLLNTTTAEAANIDPNQAAIARGEKLFFSAKESGIPGLLMGNGTQSCATCHKGGFNETNKLLFAANKQDPKVSAVIGHKNIKNFFAKDFVEDYISAIIEQGGKVENPLKPSPQITKAMGELHLFIRSRANLPFFSTWVRLDENTTHYHPKEWMNSANCKSCHPDIFNQWANSNHRLMGGSNPYYIVMENLAAKEEGEGIRFWCMGCHSPGALTSGQRRTSPTSHLFDKDGKALIDSLKSTDKEAEEGTSCLFCHRISKLEEVRGNGGYTINLRDRPKYIFEGRDGLLGKTHDAMINAKPKIHAQSYSKDFYSDSKYCMSCHDEFSPGKGAKIVNTYGEWEKSEYNKGVGHKETKGCVDCHMHASPSSLDKKVAGYSTVGGKLKDNVKTHHFVGSNHFLVGLRSAQHEKMTIDMLKAAAKIELKHSEKELTVRVSNIGAGHSLPTGVADFRELWLEVIVKDSSGKTVFSSGMLDKQGEIAPNAHIFRKVFGDKNGKFVGLKFWQYEKLLEDTRIAPKGFRDEKYTLLGDLSYPIKVDIKLNFRIYPQWVTTAVQKEFPNLPSPPVLTLHHITKTVERP
jgi:Cytochrome c554 and c-prime